MEDMPLGFRFYPTEEELISFYLHNKIERGRSEDVNQAMNRVIPVLDLYEYNAWDLRNFAGDMCNNDQEQCFFFVPRQQSEVRGGRPKRLTNLGYWKATGSPVYVYSSADNRIIGVKRTMVFYKGRAPNGTKTQWKLNEYKIIQRQASPSSNIAPQHTVLRHEYSLCRVYKKLKCLRSFDRRPCGASQTRMEKRVSTRTQQAPVGNFFDQYGSTIDQDLNPSTISTMVEMVNTISPIEVHNEAPSLFTGGYSNDMTMNGIDNKELHDWEMMLLELLETPQEMSLAGEIAQLDCHAT